MTEKLYLSMTEKLYLSDTYQFHFDSVVQKTGKDEAGVFIILDQTAFYPQGGGQTADHGLVQHDDFEMDVIHVVQSGDEIRHYISSQKVIPAGSKISCVINQERRLRNARYHTAGHLLGNIVEILNPNLKAVKGHSFPGEAYIEFHGGSDAICATTLQTAIDAAIKRNHKTMVFEISPTVFEEKYYKLPYPVPDNKEFRVMQIDGMLPVPCGGTHLLYVGEIGKYEY